MLRIVPYFSDIYKESDDGSSKLIAKNVLRHSQIEMDLIDDVTEYIDEKGKIIKSKSLVTHRELGTLILNVPCKEMWELRVKQNGFEIKGFNIGRNEKERTSRASRSNPKNRKTTRKR